MDNYNKRHRVQDRSPLPITTQVWITSEDQPVEGRVVELADTPRSYVIETPTGQVQRNLHHLNTVPEHTSQSEDQANSVLREEPQDFNNLSFTSNYTET